MILRDARPAKAALVLNAGSRTIKASVVEPATGRTLAAAQADRGAEPTPGNDRRLLEAFRHELEAALSRAVVVGHRIVHGGPEFRAPVLVDDETIERLDALAPLAPLHNPVGVAVLRAARDAFPRLSHVACFDTAFHATLPEVAWRYPLPDRWHDEWGVRRYGFHGLSVEWSAGEAARRLGAPLRELDIVVAHLGGGCSVTAVRRGRSVWTSMGLTPLEGLMMTTRSGSIDPGVILVALRRGLSVDELERTLDERSGFEAIAGTGDVREIGRRAGGGDERARLAVEMFVDRAAAEIAAATTRLRRLDAVVFTGGIGEHAPAVRRRIVARLESLRGSAALPVLVVAAREDLVIARSAVRLARAGARGRVTAGGRPHAPVVRP